MDAEGAGGCTVDMVSEAFLEYGRARPGEVKPIQEMSAARNGLEEMIKFLKFALELEPERRGGGLNLQIHQVPPYVRQCLPLLLLVDLLEPSPLGVPCQTLKHHGLLQH